jgi:20S proteasome alpha/beta subunit
VTTICANADIGMMAADSALLADPIVFSTPKLERIGDVIVGASGDAHACEAIFRWVRAGMKTSRPRFKKDAEFEALMMMRDRRLLYLEPGGSINVIKRGFGAVGSGAPFAMGAMLSMVALGFTPDPRMAATIACDLDPNSKGPIDFLTWR